jgi:crossover junction endodeoxyribonuclease RuvC
VRVLAIDPGLTRCGVGVVDGGHGTPLSMVAVDVVRTPATDEIARRLTALERAIEGWIERTQPDAVAVERMFMQHNVRTVMGTAQAAAVAILVAGRRGIPVATHTPSEVKAAVTGFGNADKAQVTAMVTRLLRLPAAPKPADAADALALAICHLWRGGAQTRIAAGRAAVDEQIARATLSRAAAGIVGNGAVRPTDNAVGRAVGGRVRGPVGGPVGGVR